MTPYVAIRHRDDVFLLPTAIDSELFVGAGRAEFVVLERVCAILRDRGRLAGGETLVDVGAHIGTTTVTALRHEGFAHAVAIEPDPAHVPLLRANVALNELDDRVTVIAAAMADAHRAGRPFAQGSRPGDASRWMKGRLADEPSPESVAVDTVTLDLLVADGIVDPAATGLLWFDCSSCEQHALTAAETFLERRVPIVSTVRRSQFADGSPLLARLEALYEHIVDLRSPSLADPVSSWQPAFRPVRELTALPERKKLTDVLLI